MTRLIVVDGVVPVGAPEPGTIDNVRDAVWNFALDQRAFGPRKLLVAFAEVDGTFRGLAFTDRTDPFAPSFDACLQYLGRGAAAAVAFNDAPVADDRSPEFVTARLDEARAIAARYGIHLVDWIDCDDDRYRATRLETVDPTTQPDWWDVTPRPGH